MDTIAYSVIDDVPEEILHHLDKLSVPQHIKGYDYLAYAIHLVSQNKSYYSSITKNLYPKVAQDFNTTPSRVERAIRHSVCKCLDFCDTEILQEYFGNSARTGNIPNSQFIFTLGNIVHRELIKSK